MKNNPMIIKYTVLDDIITYMNSEEQHVLNNIISSVKHANQSNKKTVKVISFKNITTNQITSLNSNEADWKQLISEVLDRSVSNELYEPAANARDLLKIL